MQQIAISVVSHKQGALVAELLADLEGCRAGAALEVILTLNLPEELPFRAEDFSFRLRIIRNHTPSGFGANHNQAFAYAEAPFFCVVNPDIRIHQNPFPKLLECLTDITVGVAAPLIMNGEGAIEDSARRFPTPWKIICKLLGGCRGSDYPLADENVHPDWVAGMFMCFRREVFEQMNGFDQRYFLYYEDVDLCARLRRSGFDVLLCPQIGVVHYARRSSHRNLKYMRWHVTSMFRFFLSRPAANSKRRGQITKRPDNV